MLPILIASALSFCPGVRKADRVAVESAKAVSQNFAASLSSDERLCVQEVGVDYFRFQVRRGPNAYLVIFAGPFPFGPPGQQHLEWEQGQTRRASQQGTIEDGIVMVDGRAHVRRRLIAMTKLDNVGNPTYLVIEVKPPLASKAAAEAERVLLSVKTK